MCERSWRAVEEERAFIWFARTKPGACTGSKSFRKFGLRQKCLPPGRKALAGRAISCWTPSMQPCELRDLRSSLGRVGDPCGWGWQERGKAGAPRMPTLRCERDSWSPSLPVLGARGAQQQKRLIWARWGWHSDAAKFLRCADASSKMWASVRKKGRCPWWWGYLMWFSSECFIVRKSL